MNNKSVYLLLLVILLLGCTMPKEPCIKIKVGQEDEEIILAEYTYACLKERGYLEKEHIIFGYGDEKPSYAYMQRLRALISSTHQISAYSMRELDGNFEKGYEIPDMPRVNDVLLISNPRYYVRNFDNSKIRRFELTCGSIKYFRKDDKHYHFPMYRYRVAYTITVEADSTKLCHEVWMH